MDHISAFGSLLKYGLPGLALGLFLGAIAGIVAKNLTSLTVDALKVCFKYATILFALTCVANVVPLFLDYLSGQRNSRMTIAVNVEPSFGEKYPQAVAHMKTDLTPHPADNHVDVSTHGTNSTVYVDVTAMGDVMDQLLHNNVDLKTQVSMLQKGNDERAKLYAAIVPAPQAVRDTVDKVMNAADSSAVATDTCRKSNAALCGWAHLAAGNAQAAQVSFTAAAGDPAVPKEQAASAQNGLGYTYLTEGRTVEAIQQTKSAAVAGDHGASVQLQAIKRTVKGI
ncbi:hypothetical protein DVJ77_15680 [Dyella tabacisoli]|uniref:Uncharacterized protein n=1 Tax=Dyella tabacisoli TaxID=2282381 RepID=A0A369UK08_9GAMM|nr:hypothetical protein DVJ77_15680 [Dyella tabacisoli]